MLIRYVFIFILIPTFSFGFNFLNIVNKLRIPDIPLIYPGTKWCGVGNISKSPNDLGPIRETDICCREHDMCDDVIESGQSKHGLNNSTPFTRLHCTCDLKFYNCLKICKKADAEIIGDIYFDILGLKCYRNDYPVLECIKHDNVFPNRCTKYKFNKTSSKVWSWFDIPKY